MPRPLGAIAEHTKTSSSQFGDTAASRWGQVRRSQLHVMRASRALRCEVAGDVQNQLGDAGRIGAVLPFVVMPIFEVIASFGAFSVETTRCCPPLRFITLHASGQSSNRRMRSQD